MKIKQVQKVLKSNLHLFVLIRESLDAEGAKDSPLYAAVAGQAQATGHVLPDSMRMTKEEIQTIRRQSVAATVPAPNTGEHDLAQKKLIATPGNEQPGKSLPKSGQFVVLNPNQVKR